MARPADVFIGIIDFFAVVLPGAILTGLVATEAPDLVDAVVGDLAGGTAVIVVAVSSYVLGQVAFAVGSTVLDRPYDRWVARRRERSPDAELARARELAAEELGSEKALGQISLHRWAETRVRLRSPVAGPTGRRRRASASRWAGIRSDRPDVAGVVSSR